MNCTKETKGVQTPLAQDGTHQPIWKRLLFSKRLLEKNHSHKLAYIGVTTAFMVVVNMLEIKLGGIQFSLTIFAAALAGLVLGAGSGFVACFVGDLLGFMINPFGEYSPFIGISTGLMAFILGALWLLPNLKKLWCAYLAVGCLCIFVVCTAGITTLYLNAVWYTSQTYLECLTMRLFVQGQIWNSLGNYALLFLSIPPLAKIKPLGLGF